MQSHRYVAFGFAALWLQWASCSVEEIDLTGKACPCADGWTCDEVTNRCVRPVASGGGGGGGGGGGADAQVDQSADAPADGSGGSAPAALGRACIGSQRSTAMASNRKRVSKFSLFAPQTFDAIMLYVETTGSGSTQQIKGIVYSVDANGQTDALIAVTAEASFPGNLAPGWVSMAFTTPIALEPGEYYVGTHAGPAGGVAKYSFEPAPAAARFSDDAYPDGPSAKFGSTFNGDYLISVYARPLGTTVDDSKPCPTGSGGSGGSGGTTGGGGTGAKGGTGGTTGGSGGTSSGGTSSGGTSSGGTSTGGSGGTSTGGGGSGGTSTGGGGSGGTSTGGSGGSGGSAGASGTGGLGDASLD